MLKRAGNTWERLGKVREKDEEDRRVGSTWMIPKRGEEGDEKM